MSGVSKQNVALDLAVTVRSVKRWWSTYKHGISLETKTRSGRPPILKRIKKIIIPKTLTKRRQSTRKVAVRLNTSGDPVSHMTVYRYLKDSIGAKAFIRPKKPVYRHRTSKTDRTLPRNIKIGTRKIGEEFFGLMSLPLNCMQRSTCIMIEFGLKQPKMSHAFCH